MYRLPFLSSRTAQLLAVEPSLIYILSLQLIALSVLFVLFLTFFVFQQFQVLQLNWGSVFYVGASTWNFIVCDLKETRADDLTVYFKFYEIILETSSGPSSARSC